MRTLLTSVFIWLTATGAHAADIEIQNEPRACVKGRMSMEVEVSVKGEKVSFSPSCSFSFSEEFKTKNGWSCKAKAGMCSSFSPTERFEVECEGNAGAKAKAGIPILCRATSGKEKKIVVEVNQLACAKGKMSTDVTVRVGKQEYEFEPSCRFTFSKGFQTKDGVRCQVEAGMCSSFSPKNLFQVKCEDGSYGESEVKCP